MRSNLRRPSGPRRSGQRGLAGGRAPRAEKGEPDGARTYPEARARASALLHVHLDCRGGAGDGTTSPPAPPRLALSPPPLLSCPDACSGLGAAGAGGAKSLRSPQRRDSRALSAMMSTASSAAPPPPPHPGPRPPPGLRKLLSRASNLGFVAESLQCPKPLTPFAIAEETGWTHCGHQGGGRGAGRGTRCRFAGRGR